MRKSQTKPIVQGAMMAAICGVFAILNTYTASIGDVILSYIMAGCIAWYAEEYRITYTCGVWIAITVIVFFTGQLWFFVVSIPTLWLGMYYGVLKKRKGAVPFLGLCAVSFIKNFVTYVVCSGVLEVTFFEEGKEIYEVLVGWIPMLRSLLSVEILLIVLWMLIVLLEAYCMKQYTPVLQKRLFKKK